MNIWRCNLSHFSGTTWQSPNKIPGWKSSIEVLCFWCIFIFSQAFKSLDGCKPRETNILKWKHKCVSRGSVGSVSFEYFSGWYVESAPSSPKIRSKILPHHLCSWKLEFFSIFTTTSDYIYTSFQQNISSSIFRIISPICFLGSIRPAVSPLRFRGPSMEPSMSYSEEEQCATSVPPQRVAPPQHREEGCRERSLEVIFFPWNYDIMGYGCCGILWDIFSWNYGWHFFNLAIWMDVDGWIFWKWWGLGKINLGCFFKRIIVIFFCDMKKKGRIIVASRTLGNYHIPPWGEETHLQKCLGKGYVNSQEGKNKVSCTVKGLDTKLVQKKSHQNGLNRDLTKKIPTTFRLGLSFEPCWRIFGGKRFWTMHLEGPKK